MSNDTMQMVHQDPLLGDAMQSQGESMPFHSVDQRGKGMFDGDNVFGARDGFQPFAQRMYPQMWAQKMQRGQRSMPPDYRQKPQGGMGDMMGGMGNK